MKKLPLDGKIFDKMPERREPEKLTENNMISLRGECARSSSAQAGRRLDFQ